MDPFVASDRSAAFKQASQLEKARKLLAVIDQSCRCLGLPIPCGASGVTFVGELPSTAMVNLRWEAKLDRPPSTETFQLLFQLIRERGE